MTRFATTSSFTQARRLKVGIAAALATIASLPITTFAQDCGGSWLSDQSAPGLNRNGKAHTFELLPDGSILVGGNFTLAGNVHTYNIARFDPASGHWSTLGTGAPSFVNDILPLPDGDLLVGGEPDVSSFGLSRYHASTNTWTSPAIGITGLNYLTFVEALASTTTSDVVVGGWFTSAGGIPTSAIARYNPVTDVWSTFGTGLTMTTPNPPNMPSVPFARCLLPLPGGDLIVAGNFDTANGAPANCIARLNPATGAWSALGAGLNGWVNSLALDTQGNLVVGGAFTSANGLPAARVARYNFATGAWSPLGAGFPESTFVIDLITSLPDGDLFAAGRTTPGTVTVRMSRFSQATQTWTTVTTGNPAGAAGIYCSTALPDGSILLGGDFELINGASANSIAAFTPASGAFAPLTLGNSGPVSNLVGLADNSILAFGSFQSLGGATSPGAARFNPATNTWSPLQGRPSDIRSTTLLANGDVILGGNFVSAGSVPANRVVRYTPGTGAFSALGNGVAGTGYTAVAATLELPDGDLIIGGTFSTAGPIPANRIARYAPSTETWSTLGAGLSFEVQSLSLIDNGDLLAGTAGGLFRYSFTTNTWSTPLALGATSRGPVNQILTLSDGRILLAAQATWSNSALAIFDPAANTYSALATVGINEVFSHLRRTGDQVAVGGTFRVPGVPTSRNIAKFNPNTLTWTPLQSGFNEPLLSMDVLPNGDLVAGGYFTRAGDVTSPYFARYRHNTADFNNDGDTGTDADIEAFFLCLAGTCCPSCASADFNSDGDTGTDSDIESFFRVLAGGPC